MARIKWCLDLDLSSDSAKALEDLLSKLWSLSQSAPPGEKPNQTQIGVAVFMYGAYLGETLRKIASGIWVALGGPAKRPGLRIGENTVDPIGRVNARLLEGVVRQIVVRYVKRISSYLAEAGGLGIAG